ncbi:MAG: tectonin domain-containing protein, partial [bacterium]
MRLMKKLLALVFALLAMGHVYADMVPAVWGVNVGNLLYFRSGVTKEVLTGTGWVNIAGPEGKGIKYVSVSPKGQVWITTVTDEIYYRKGIAPANPTGTEWFQPEDRSIVRGVKVVVSDDSIWHINSLGVIYVAITSDANPASLNWIKVPGSLSDISVNKDGVVWGVNSNNDIFFWNAFVKTQADVTGNKWIQVPGKLSQITVGSVNGQPLVWGVNKDGYSFYRKDASLSSLIGTDWTQVDGARSYKYVSADNFKGVLWAIDFNDHVFVKTGVDLNNAGTNWNPVAGGLRQISVGNIAVFDRMELIVGIKPYHEDRDLIAAKIAAADKAAADKAAADKAAADKAAADAAAEKAAAEKAAADKAAADKAAADKAAADKAAADKAAAEAAL